VRLIFMGSPDFAVPTLAALLDAGHEVVHVYSQPPRPAGRGQRQRLAPVHAFAEARGLAVRTPAKLKEAAEHAAFAALGADAAVIAAYGLILPTPILEAPVLGCINVHASLLPRWRGAAPIQRAIMAGDTETGVTIMGVEKGLDSGPIILAGSLPITATTTAPELHDALSQLGAGLMVEALDGLAAGRLTPTPQPEEGVTHAAKLGPDDGRLDWRRPAVELERAVRALNPWPGTWFEHDGGRIKVLAAEIAGADAEPGTVLDQSLMVACGSGALRPTRLQRPGKAPTDSAAFLRGYPIGKGTRLMVS
jgi:methionyl-tRNA formyltransferase